PIDGDSRGGRALVIRARARFAARTALCGTVRSQRPRRRLSERRRRTYLVRPDRCNDHHVGRLALTRAVRREALRRHDRVWPRVRRRGLRGAGALNSATLTDEWEAVTVQPAR